MRAFACPRCTQLVPFEAVGCPACGAPLGFDPDAGEITDRENRIPCANHVLAGCNWLLAPAERPGDLCRSCALTRTRPHHTDLAPGASVSEAFRAAEAAKRRLVFQLFELGLPVVRQDGEQGLAFDLLSSAAERVVIGHDDGDRSPSTWPSATTPIGSRCAATSASPTARCSATFATRSGTTTGRCWWNPTSRRWRRSAPCSATSGPTTPAALRRATTTRGRPASWVVDYVSAYATCPSVGGLGRDLRPLPPHPGHGPDRGGIRDVDHRPEAGT